MLKHSCCNAKVAPDLQRQLLHAALRVVKTVEPRLGACRSRVCGATNLLCSLRPAQSTARLQRAGSASPRIAACSAELKAPVVLLSGRPTMRTSGGSQFAALDQEGTAQRRGAPPALAGSLAAMARGSQVGGLNGRIVVCSCAARLASRPMHRCSYPSPQWPPYPGAASGAAAPAGPLATATRQLGQPPPATHKGKRLMRWKRHIITSQPLIISYS